MTRARGSFALLRSAWVVGIALMVERWYDGSALENGEVVKVAFGGRITSGGGWCNSCGSGGDVSKLVV